MLKKIILAVVALIVIPQLFQIDKTNPVAEPDLDFIAITHPSAQIGNLIKTACYDCHSYQTKYPWYTSIQPLGWWIKDHVKEGRDELNFSEWGSFPTRRADHKLEESAELVLDDEMPLPSYLKAHPEARLSTEQREMLAFWFETQRSSLEPDSSAAPQN